MGSVAAFETQSLQQSVLTPLRVVLHKLLSPFLATYFPIILRQVIHLLEISASSPVCFTRTRGINIYETSMPLISKNRWARFVESLRLGVPRAGLGLLAFEG